MAELQRILNKGLLIADNLRSDMIAVRAFEALERTKERRAQIRSKVELKAISKAPGDLKRSHLGASSG